MTATIAGLTIEKLEDKETGVKMLVYGQPGVGKTYFSSSAPKALFVDVEGGTLSIKNAGRNIDIVKVNKFADIFQIHKFLMSGQHNYQTVIVDSLTELQKKSLDGIIEEAYRKDPLKRDPDIAELRDWSKNTAQLRKAVRYFRDLPMHVIFTALEKEVKDEQTGALRVGPDLTPKLQSDVAGYLDIIAHMSAREKEDGILRQMLFQPTGKYMAKDRSGKLGKVLKNPTFPMILDLIEGRTTAGQQSESSSASSVS